MICEKQNVSCKKSLCQADLRQMEKMWNLEKIQKIQKIQKNEQIWKEKNEKKCRFLWNKIFVYKCDFDENSENWKNWKNSENSENTTSKKNKIDFHEQKKANAMFREFFKKLNEVLSYQD